MKSTLIPALFLLAASLAAQTTSAPVSAALRDVLSSQQKNTVAAMPADKFNYKPSADQRTFSQLVIHMADANYFRAAKLPTSLRPRSSR